MPTRCLTPSGKFEIYCQTRADALNATGRTEGYTWKPYPSYKTPVNGYEATFSDWENKVKGDYPYQIFNPHYLRRSHTQFDNLPWLRHAFPNPVSASMPPTRRRRASAQGDVVRIWNDAGQTLRPVERHRAPDARSHRAAAWPLGSTSTRTRASTVRATRTSWCAAGHLRARGRRATTRTVVNFEKYDGRGARGGLPACRSASRAIEEIGAKGHDAIRLLFQSRGHASAARPAKWHAATADDLAPGVTFRAVESYEAGTYPDATRVPLLAHLQPLRKPRLRGKLPHRAPCRRTRTTARCSSTTTECIGCGTCVKSCPYGVPMLQDDEGHLGQVRRVQGVPRRRAEPRVRGRLRDARPRVRRHRGAEGQAPRRGERPAHPARPVADCRPRSWSTRRHRRWTPTSGRSCCSGLTEECSGAGAALGAARPRKARRTGRSLRPCDRQGRLPPKRGWRS